ncbi:MAG: 23S rRNA (guanosine(2251)-2'-O)-methyltransferase RlmB [Bacteroidetes bacterium]|uniref:23S rRNA (Guanosine(2251)-2'-O)-methyltransferase RlmB n=1 Tax=Candidatus Caccoplasma merdipullorum TaxID=2840718 RepID=A0A9D9H833_9BACT|nr:23S rRNA (guanosine(2251)-2'-O)-methyltransferase RlmB [Candidatus Caccoplasma merdipullorum]
MTKREDMVFGIRAVIEAVEAGKEIDRVLLKRDFSGELAGELFAVLKDNGIRPQRVPVEKLNAITRKNHQGVIAYISPVNYQPIEEIIASVYDRGETPFIVVLDHITDVRNFGAIARTAECAGVHAVVIPSRGSVTVTADAVKTSAGALLTLPVCRPKSLEDAVKYMKSCGLQIVTASEKASTNYTKADMTLPTAIIMGAEDKGVSATLSAISDVAVSMPQFGKIASLNVSVATGILLYEVVRQRNAG